MVAAVHSEGLADKVKATLFDKLAKVRAFGMTDGVNRGLTRSYQAVGALAMAAGVILAVNTFQAKTFEKQAAQISAAQPLVAAAVEQSLADNDPVEWMQTQIQQAKDASRDIDKINELLTASGGKLTADFARQMHPHNPYIAAVAAAMAERTKSLQADVPDIRYPSEYAARPGIAYMHPATPNAASPDGLYWERVVLPGGYSLGQARTDPSSARKLKSDLQAAGVPEKVARVLLDPASTPDDVRDLTFLPAQALALARIEQPSEYRRMEARDQTGLSPTEFMSDDQKAALAMVRGFHDQRINKSIDELVAAQYAAHFAEPKDKASLIAARARSVGDVMAAILASDSGTARERVVAAMMVSGQTTRILVPELRLQEMGKMAAGEWNGLKEALSQESSQEASGTTRPTLKI